MKHHPAAEAWPMMPESRYVELVDDIRENGQRVPVTMFEGMILDGRNRAKACAELGIAPVTVDFSGNPWDYVWSLNGLRRDLVDEQRYLLWKFCNERSAEWQAQREAAAAEANAKRSAATKAQHAVSNPRAGETMVSVQSDQTPDPTPGRTAKAAASHTNAGAVARGDRLAEEREDLAAEVRAGRMKPAEAHRRMKRDSVAQRVAALPDDVFRVIYADPPWKYGDERVGVAESTAAEHHYPTMPVADICALPVREIAASDAVLFLWATFPLLPDALAVVAAWGFKYKTAFVWAKGRPNMGHYHQADAELLLVATRGSCTPDVDTRETQVQLVKRTGRHSAKPEDFRDMIDRMYPHGARVELFARSAAPDGWCVWGNEA